MNVNNDITIYLNCDLHKKFIYIILSKTKNFSIVYILPTPMSLKNIYKWTNRDCPLISDIPIS